MPRPTSTPRTPHHRSAFALMVESMHLTTGGLKQDFARSIGVSPTMLSQILGDLYQQPSVELCLRLSMVGARPFATVLRAAGRADMADLIEARDLREVVALAKGSRDRAALSAYEVTIITRWRDLDAEQVRALDAILTQSATAARLMKTTRRRRRR